MSDAHELAHELRDVIAATVDAYMSFQEAQGRVVGPVVALLALEMEASIARRLCRDAGLSKEQVKDVQTSASSCGKFLYEEMSKAPEEQEHVHDVSIGPLDN